MNLYSINYRPLTSHPLGQGLGLFFLALSLFTACVYGHSLVMYGMTPPMDLMFPVTALLVLYGFRFSLTTVGIETAEGNHKRYDFTVDFYGITLRAFTGERVSLEKNGKLSSLIVEGSADNKQDTYMTFTNKMADIHLQVFNS